MINRAITLILRTTDLIEAEGRAARAAIAELVVAATILAVGAALLLLAVASLAGALALALCEAMSPASSLALAGLVVALFAVVAAMAGWRLAMPRRR